MGYNDLQRPFRFLTKQFNLIHNDQKLTLEKIYNYSDESGVSFNGLKRFEEAI